MARPILITAPRRPTRQIHVGHCRRGRRRPDLGAVDDHHEDGRRRGDPRPDLRAGSGRSRHRALHVQRAGGRRGPGPHRAAFAGPDHRRHPLPPRDGARRPGGRGPGPAAQPRQPAQGSRDQAGGAQEAKDRGVPIRIGVNAGSLHPELYKRYGGATPEALVESARMELAYFAEVGFDDVKISVKASSVPAHDRGLPAGVGDLRPSPAPGRDRGRTAPGRAHQGHRRHRHPAGRGHRRHHPVLAHRRPRGRGAGRAPAPRGHGAARAQGPSTSSPARRAGGPRST